MKPMVSIANFIQRFWGLSNTSFIMSRTAIYTKVPAASASKMASNHMTVLLLLICDNTDPMAIPIGVIIENKIIDQIIDVLLILDLTRLTPKANEAEPL